MQVVAEAYVRLYLRMRVTVALQGKQNGGSLSNVLVTGLCGPERIAYINST